MGEHLLHRLSAVAALGPCLLLIDDAQLSDRPSLTAVSYALRRLQSEPILTLLVSRTEGVDRLPSGLLNLVDAGGFRLALDGISASETRELAAAYGHPGIGARAARRLHDHTGGNPLYLRTLLQHGGLEGSEWLAAPLVTPTSFARLVSAQLQDVSASACHLARAAAVVGMRCDLRAAAAISETSSELRAAEELHSKGILAVVRSPHLLELVFSHSLIRAAVMDDMTTSTRASLNLAASKVTGGVNALFHRSAATAGSDSGLAAELVAHADCDIARGSWRTAASALLEAARIMPLGQADNNILLRAVDALLVAGDLAVAAGYREQVAALPPTARRLQVQALMAWMSGEFATAEAHAVHAWSSARELEPAERDRLAGLLAQMCIMQGKNQAAIDWSEAALRSGLLDRRREASTTATLVAAMSLEGRGAEAFALLPTGGDVNDAGYREAGRHARHPALPCRRSKQCSDELAHPATPQSGRPHPRSIADRASDRDRA